jgi:putative addiction module component (TIGR02574 family)
MGVLKMVVLYEKIKEDALLLPPEARIELIEKLIESLNLPIQTEIDHLWAEEAERRIKEFDEGRVTGIPGEQVFNEIRAKLKK